MISSVVELASQNFPAYQQAQPILETLLKAEVADYEVSRIAYQIKAVKFPVYRELYGFDFSESTVDEYLIRGLHRSEFIKDSQNIVLVGGLAQGKLT